MEKLRSLIDQALEQLERIPHGPDAPGRLLDYLTGTNPALLLGSLLALCLTAIIIRRYGRHAVAAAFGFTVLSFLIFSSGRATVSRANTLPLKERPTCLALAVVNGAVWKRERLDTVKACATPQQERIERAKPKIDDASDGYLTGLIDGPDWIADVEMPASSTKQSALTVSDGGIRSVYFQQGGFAVRVDSCPDDGGTVPAAILGDASGAAYADYVFRLAVPATVASVARASAASTVEQGPRTGIYRFKNAAGLPVGYLLPVAGAHGYCAVLSGPWRRNGDTYSFVRSPSAGALKRMEQVALTVRVVDLRNEK